MRLWTSAREKRLEDELLAFVELEAHEWKGLGVAYSSPKACALLLDASRSVVRERVKRALELLEAKVAVAGDQHPR